MLLWIALPILSAVLSAPEDREFLQRLRRREPDAAAQLYDRYGRIIYSLVFRMVRNQSVAEELVQEAFLRIWNRSEFFDSERGSFVSWVLAVARNQAIDYLRSVTGRQWKGEIGIESTAEPALFNNLDDGIFQSDRARHVRAAMGRLKQHQREVIELAYFEGLSQSEIAEKLRQPLGTVKTWMRAGLKVLREELTESVAA